MNADVIRDAETNGINYGHTTDDVIAKLTDWDARHGVTINAAKMDSVDFTLSEIPKDLDAFAREVYAFCPDTVDQGFGLMCEDDAEPNPDNPNCMAHLCKGVDFGDPEFGVMILQNSLASNPRIVLWWD